MDSWSNRESISEEGYGRNKEIRTTYKKKQNIYNKTNISL